LEDGEMDKAVRVGVEDPVKGIEKEALKNAMGYVISREDVGKWMFQHLIKEGQGEEYTGKAVMISYWAVSCCASCGGSVFSLFRVSNLVDVERYSVSSPMKSCSAGGRLDVLSEEVHGVSLHFRGQLYH
jgi:hypothetical protein